MTDYSDCSEVHKSKNRRVHAHRIFLSLHIHSEKKNTSHWISVCQNAQNAQMKKNYQSRKLEAKIKIKMEM